MPPASDSGYPTTSRVTIREADGLVIAEPNFSDARVEVLRADHPTSVTTNRVECGREETELSMANDKSRSQGLWIKCSDCGEILYHREVTGNHHVCPRCGYHFRISADQRFKMFFDNGKYKRLFGKIRSSDPLGFVDSKPYSDRLKVYNKKFNGTDAVVVAQGEINKIPTVIAAMEYGFMGGSMGSAVGEKADPSHRALPRSQAAVDHRFMLGRRAHAGGDPVVDAAGKGFGGARTNA